MTYKTRLTESLLAPEVDRARPHQPKPPRLQNPKADRNYRHLCRRPKNSLLPIEIEL